MIDVNSMHTYPSPKSGYSNTIYEPDGIYASSNDTFSFYRNILSNANQTNKDFWCDEYFVHAADADLGQNVGMLGTQFAAGLVAGMNNGINRMLSWQMFDGYWDNTATYSTGEFVGGIHICGTCPRLPGTGCSDSNCKCHAYTEESYTPRDTYYALNLLGKHLNNKNADVLNTSIVDKAVESDSGLFVGAIKNDKNQTVILVVNTLSTVSTVEINLEKSVNSSFSRYVYNPNEIVADENATSIPSDKSFDLNKTTSFSDVIPAQSFAIYVQDDVVYGDDVDMPLDDIL